MKFFVELDIGNDAMQDADDVEEMLQKAIEQLHLAGPLDGLMKGSLRDRNGNLVGQWLVTDGD